MRNDSRDRQVTGQNIWFVLLFAVSAGCGSRQPLLTVAATPTPYDTGTMHYCEALVFRVPGYEPLSIAADVEKGVFPPHVGRPMPLGDDMFMVIGLYSVGSGTETDVGLLLALRDGRVTMLDSLERQRSRAQQRARFVLANSGSALRIEGMGGSSSSAE
jgi:hypothetical protein